MTGKFPCYLRAPSSGLLTLLQPGEFLSPLICLNERNVQGLCLDVHFRPGDQVAVYCGRANILTVELRPPKLVRVTANDSYRQQYPSLFCDWRIDDSGFRPALNAYIGVLEVESTYVRPEGRVQTQWSKETRHWTTFDKEAMLSYETKSHRNSDTDYPETRDARKELDHIVNADGEPWSNLDRNWSPLKLDLLACDREGQLVPIEVKHSLSDYYAPFQLLHYVWEWYRALKDNCLLLAELQTLIESRAELGLSSSFGRITNRIRPVVAVGEKDVSKKTQSRYGKVLQMVNRHLPPDVSPVETWRHRNGRPERLP